MNFNQNNNQNQNNQKQQNQNNRQNQQNNQQQNQNQRLTCQRQTYHAPAAGILPPVRAYKQQISDSHQQKDLPVSGKQLPDKFRMESRKNLTNHGSRSLERGVSEKDPAEANEMESQDHGEKASPSGTPISLGAPQQAT